MNAATWSSRKRNVAGSSPVKSRQKTQSVIPWLGEPAAAKSAVTAKAGCVWQENPRQPLALAHPSPSPLSGSLPRSPPDLKVSERGLLSLPELSTPRSALRHARNVKQCSMPAAAGRGWRSLLVVPLATVSDPRAARPRFLPGRPASKGYNSVAPKAVRSGARRAQQFLGDHIDCTARCHHVDPFRRRCQS
jgi:hypothetical protein